VTLQMVTEHPNFVVHVGDIAYQSGTYNEFTANYFEYYYTLMRRACFFTIAGITNISPRIRLPTWPCMRRPPTPYRPWTAANTTPSTGQTYTSSAWDANLLDPHFADAQARMLAWFDNDLANTHATWKIVFFHQTAYPIFIISTTPSISPPGALFVPILERHGVQLVLSGHEHNYQRSKPMRASVPVPVGTGGTVYMVSGGGGGDLHPWFQRVFSIGKRPCGTT